MTDFTITKNFPRSEIEFDARFTKPEECYEVKGPPIKGFVK